MVQFVEFILSFLITCFFIVMLLLILYCKFQIGSTGSNAGFIIFCIGVCPLSIIFHVFYSNLITCWLSHRHEVNLSNTSCGIFSKFYIWLFYFNNKKNLLCTFTCLMYHFEFNSISSYRYFKPSACIYFSLSNQY